MDEMKRVGKAFECIGRLIERGFVPGRFVPSGTGSNRKARRAVRNRLGLPRTAGPKEGSS
jgi:hypothetical protein